MNKAVITLAGGRYLPGAAVQAMELKALGCDWPHIVFTVPGDEVPKAYRRLFLDLDVEMREITSYLGHPWTAKTSAVMAMKDTEVLFLDSDNILMVDPEVIRLNPRYQAAGSMFWKDFGSLEANHPLYKFCGLEPKSEDATAQESGQLMLHTGRCEKALSAMHEVNKNWREIYETTRGDKEIWQLVWAKTGHPFVWGSEEIDIILDDQGHGRAIIQKLDSRACCHHRVHAKFSLTEDNWWRPGIPNSIRWFEHLEFIRSKVL